MGKYIWIFHSIINDDYTKCQLFYYFFSNILNCWNILWKINGNVIQHESNNWKLTEEKESVYFAKLFECKRKLFLCLTLLSVFLGMSNCSVNIVVLNTIHQKIIFKQPKVIAFWSSLWIRIKIKEKLCGMNKFILLIN